MQCLRNKTFAGRKGEPYDEQNGISRPDFCQGLASRKRRAGGGGSASLGGIAVRAQEAPRYTVINTFAGIGADGEYPRGNVIRDQAGNLYGTTFNGGNLGECFGAGCGVVFKVDRWGKETVLYNFMGGADGAYPAAGLVPDEEGNLYGTTHGGGDLAATQAARQHTDSPGAAWCSSWIETAKRPSSTPSPGVRTD